VKLEYETVFVDWKDVMYEEDVVRRVLVYKIGENLLIRNNIVRQ